MSSDLKDVLLAIVQYAFPALITGYFGFLVASRRKRK
jgi:hypothetical protein